MRCFDGVLIDKGIKHMIGDDDRYDAIKWLSDPRNIALTNDNGDLVLFEYEKPGVVTGHYYLQSRGKEAIKGCRIFLDEAFFSCYNIEVIRGLTPLTNLGARWMCRKLGFTNYGVIKTNTCPFELFILTKKEYAA